MNVNNRNRSEEYGELIVSLNKPSYAGSLLVLKLLWLLITLAFEEL